MRKINVRWAIAIFILIIICICTLSWNSFQSYGLIKKITTKDVEAVRLHDDIAYLDELLTIYLREAVLKKETSPPARYDTLTVRIFAEIDKALLILPKDVSKKFEQQTKHANDELTRLEDEVIKLMKNRNWDKAYQIMNSQEYDTNKKAYSKGLKFIQGYLSQSSQNIKQKQNSSRRTTLSASVLALLALVGIVFLLRQQLQLYKKLHTSFTEVEEQKNEILTQNEEILQQQEEVSTQRDALAEVNQEITKVNKNMTDSIRYAFNIQQAMLPSQKWLNALLPEHFILYQPKDIVSGDFYWVSEVGESIIVMVVDCTGHGVPGAFMSLIGDRLLRQIINEKQTCQPAYILDQLNTKVIEKLRQTERQSSEGMDVCLCKITPTPEGDYALTYAGAKRPLYCVKDNKLKIIKGCRVSIGGWPYDSKPHFKDYQVLVPKGSMLYLTTDGFADTPSPKRKSFGSKRFENLLKKVAHLPLADQHQEFIRTKDAYQQQEAQRDDITVLGIRLP